MEINVNQENKKVACIHFSRYHLSSQDETQNLTDSNTRQNEKLFHQASNDGLNYKKTHPIFKKPNAHR